MVREFPSIDYLTLNTLRFMHWPELSIIIQVGSSEQLLIIGTLNS